jgi:hypothetical protein
MVAAFAVADDPTGRDALNFSHFGKICRGAVDFNDRDFALRADDLFGHFQYSLIKFDMLGKACVERRLGKLGKWFP